MIANVACSQLKNKNKAMKVLRARLFEMYQAEQNEKMSKERREQIGSGDRDPSVLEETDGGAEHGHLQAGVTLVVADKQAGCPQRELVHRAGHGNAEALIAVPAPVLHRGEQTGREDLEDRIAHALGPPEKS